MIFSIVFILFIAGKILTGIDIIRHLNGLGSSAESIVDKIIEKQSLEVDAVSGATLSSKCILKAVENAVENKSDR